MNILRIIKLIQINDELENLTSVEKLFFKLHENLHETPYGELCNDLNEWVVQYDFKENCFWFQYHRFYLVFKRIFHISLQDFKILCKSILIKYNICHEYIEIKTSFS